LWRYVALGAAAAEDLLVGVLREASAAVEQASREVKRPIRVV
jgi:hypothetical protein